MDNQLELDRLFEELTLTKVQLNAVMPPYDGYDSRWNNMWRPTTDGYDYAYFDSDRRKHRLFGPAYTSSKYGIQEWYKHGEFHRIDGPAIIHKNNQYWYKEGKKHRLDGPAIITGGGPKQFWIEGQKLSPKEYKKEIARRKRKGLIK
jgi:hypothetical protein